MTSAAAQAERNAALEYARASGLTKASEIILTSDGDGLDGGDFKALRTILAAAVLGEAAEAFRAAQAWEERAREESG